MHKYLIFIRSSVEHILTIINIGVHVSFQTMSVSFSLDIDPGVELLSHGSFLLNHILAF